MKLNSQLACHVSIIDLIGTYLYEEFDGSADIINLAQPVG
jgi:hypothetical protein